MDSNIAEMMNDMNMGMSGFKTMNSNIFDMNDMMGGSIKNPLSEMLNKKRNPKIHKIYELCVTLDELHKGTHKKIIVETNIKFNKCDGN